MPRTRKPPADDPGPFARMLVTARHAAQKNVEQCAIECGLSRTFLTMIETGKRCPELERVPAIGLAYKANVAELCWVWITSWAPAAVPHLAVSVDYEANPVLRAYLEQSYAAQQAEKAAHAAEQRARIAAVLDRPMPTVPPFEQPTGYQQVGPRALQRDAQGTLAPWETPDSDIVTGRRK